MRRRPQQFTWAGKTRQRDHPSRTARVAGGRHVNGARNTDNEGAQSGLSGSVGPRLRAASKGWCAVIARYISKTSFWLAGVAFVLAFVTEVRVAHATCGTYATYRYELYANPAPSICGATGFCGFNGGNPVECGGGQPLCSNLGRIVKDVRDCETGAVISSPVFRSGFVCAHLQMAPTMIRVCSGSTRKELKPTCQRVGPSA